MPSAETRRVLDDLKKAGLDLSSIENQLASNVFIDKQVDTIIGGGILRQPEFTRITNQYKRDNEKLQEQVNKLAALHDNVEGFKGNDQIYQSALETIVELEDALIQLGHNPDEVKKVSYASKSGLSTVLNKEVEKPNENGNNNNNNVVKKEGEDEMGLDPSKFVSVEDYQKSMAQVGTGALLVADKLNDFKTEARSLGIVITEEMNSKLHERIQREFLTGQTPINLIADQVLGISAKKSEVTAANKQKEIEDARAAGRAEGRSEAEKEYGGPPKRQVGRVESPIYARRANQNYVMPDNKVVVKKNEDGKIEVPVNSKGEAELFKLRGDRGSRIGKSLELLNNPEAMKELALQD